MVINFFDIQRTVHRDIVLYKKPTRCTNSQLYFAKNLHVSDRFTAHPIIRSLNTVFTANVICHTSYDVCLLDPF